MVATGLHKDGFLGENTMWQEMHMPVPNGSKFMVKPLHIIYILINTLHHLINRNLLACAVQFANYSAERLFEPLHRSA